MATANGSAGKGRWLLGVGVLLLLGVGAYLGWLWWHRPPEKPAVDMAKVLELNQRGAVLMDQYRFREAHPVFEEVAQMAPDWIPGKINLGIVLIVRGNNPEGGKEERKKEEDRVLGLFNEVLAVEPENPYANFNIGYVMLEWKSDLEKAESYFEKVVKQDPNDAFAWYWLGRCQEEKPEAALASFRRAIALDPYHSAALYGLQSALRSLGRDADATEALKQWEQFAQAPPRTGGLTDVDGYGEVPRARPLRPGDRMDPADHAPSRRATSPVRACRWFQGGTGGGRALGPGGRLRIRAGSRLAPPHP